MNNEQIDQTDYYRLPCGKYLEDFMHEMCLDFAEGSALKYVFRAGHKDGESYAKDVDKARHYVEFMARHELNYTADQDEQFCDAAWNRVIELYELSQKWDGKELI